MEQTNANDSTIIDIANPSTIIPIQLQPGESLQVEYKYLQTFSIIQNEFYTFKLPVSSSIPYQITIDF